MIPRKVIAKVVKKLHQCSRCNRCFSKQQSLIHHVRNECGIPSGFKCPYCNHRGRQTSLIYAHIQKKHPRKEVYILDDF